MANHASTRTTQLYDRRAEEVMLDEVERISFEPREVARKNQPPPADGYRFRPHRRLPTKPRNVGFTAYMQMPMKSESEIDNSSKKWREDGQNSGGVFSAWRRSPPITN